MKRLWIIPTLGSLLMFATLTVGCKKKKAFNEESAQSTVDARSAQGESDEVIKDVNIAVMEDALLRGRSVESAMSATTSLCGVDLDISKVATGILTLKYNGSSCFGRTRTGSVRITIVGYPLTKWKNKGAVMRLEYIKYKMLRSSDGKSVELNGMQELKNESGNTWYELWFLAEPNVVYSVTGNEMTALFDGNSSAVFSFSRRMTYTFANEVITCRVEGTGSTGGRSAVENWGQTRDGEEFTTSVTEPYVWKTECGAMAPVSGEVSVQVAEKEFDLKCFFGTDSNGDKFSEKCPFGWRVEWSRKKRTNTRVFGYY
jgi:hypothetical protein